ncbi:MAG: C25 family cysteine peptidase, partial [Pyrinomonadaceae bacterium]
MKKFLSAFLLLILIYAQAAAAPPEVRLSSFTAKSYQGGVVIEWRSGFELDNLGYNIYRVKNGRRTRINAEIIAGSALFAGQGNALHAGRSYVWRDAQGTGDALYYLESINLTGEHQSYGPITPVPGSDDPKQQSSAMFGESGAGDGGSSAGTQKDWSSASLIPQSPQSAQGPLEDQFEIASQFALKIRVQQDGLYRITQPELVAAGLDPNVDADYLRLYADGYEQALIVKSTDGHLAASDYVEFYGYAMDTPTTDTRTYYLFRGTVPGKRMIGGGILKPDSTVVPNPQIVSSSGVKEFAPPQSFFWGVLPVFAAVSNSENENSKSGAEPEQAKEARDKEAKNKGFVEPAPNKTFTEKRPARKDTQVKESQIQAPAPTEIVAQAEKETAPAQDANSAQEPLAAPKTQPRKRRISNRRKRINKRGGRRHHNHASVNATAATPVFTNRVERKDRTVYFSSLLNGADTENFFGQVLVNTPITQTLNIHHLDTSSGGEVRLEVALQGITLQDHHIKVFFNNTEVGVLNYGYHDHSAVSILLSPGLAVNGDNAIKFVNVGPTGDANIIDYARIIYAHTYTADNNALRFTMKSGQVVSVGGFTTPNIRVFEISDPQNVREIHPLVEQSGGTYSITVEAVDQKVKGRRTFVALPDTQFSHPAAIVQNQPSSLHAVTTGADLVIISHSNFIQSVAPLAQLRTSQGLVVNTVDVEDLYDEFSYGIHTPQAIKDFLKNATDHWTKTPRYVLLVCDASLDPRNYLKNGNFDFVPSRTVDTDYTETVSDEMLADFDNDYVAEIPIGRLPARTVADCDVLVSKIVNYTPAA